MHRYRLEYKPGNGFLVAEDPAGDYVRYSEFSTRRDLCAMISDLSGAWAGIIKMVPDTEIHAIRKMGARMLQEIDAALSDLEKMR